MPTYRRAAYRPLTWILPLILLLAACARGPAETAVAPGAVPEGAAARLGKGSMTSLATAGGRLFVADRTGVSSYEAITLEQGWSTASAAPVTSVASSADGRWVLAGLENSELLLLDGESGAIRSGLPGPDTNIDVVSVAWGPGEEPLFVAGYNDGELLAGRVERGELEPLGRLATLGSGVTALAFNPDGRILAAADRGGLITLYDMGSLGQLTSLRGHDVGQAVGALAWNAEGDRLVSGDKKGAIIAWDMQRLAPQTRLPQQKGAITGLSFTAQGELLGAATAGGELLTWETAGSEMAPQRVELGTALSGVSWAGDGQSVTVALADGRLARHAASDGVVKPEAEKERRDHAPAGARVGALALSPDGKRLLVALGQEALVWNMETGALEMRRGGHDASTTAAAWAADGRSFATADRQGRVVVRESSSGEEVQRLQGTTQAVTDLAWSPDGAQLAAATSLADLVQIWDPATGEALRSYEGEGPGLWSVAWSPEGTELLAGGVDGQMYVFDTTAADGAPVETYWRHVNWISDLAWAAGGQVASSSADNSVVLWDLALGNSAPRDGHRAAVRGVDFNPEGTRLVSVGLDGQVIVWDADARTRQPLVTRMWGHADGITAVDWAPDGETIVTGSDDGTVIVWEAPE